MEQFDSFVQRIGVVDRFLPVAHPLAPSLGEHAVAFLLRPDEAPAEEFFARWATIYEEADERFGARNDVSAFQAFNTFAITGEETAFKTYCSRAEVLLDLGARVPSACASVIRSAPIEDAGNDIDALRTLILERYKVFELRFISQTKSHAPGLRDQEIWTLLTGAVEEFNAVCRAMGRLATSDSEFQALIDRLYGRIDRPLRTLITGERTRVAMQPYGFMPSPQAIEANLDAADSWVAEITKRMKDVMKISWEGDIRSASLLICDFSDEARTRWSELMERKALVAFLWEASDHRHNYRHPCFAKVKREARAFLLGSSTLPREYFARWNSAHAEGIFPRNSDLSGMLSTIHPYFEGGDEASLRRARFRLFLEQFRHRVFFYETLKSCPVPDIVPPEGELLQLALKRQSVFEGHVFKDISQWSHQGVLRGILSPSATFQRACFAFVRVDVADEEYDALVQAVCVEFDVPLRALRLRGQLVQVASPITVPPYEDLFSRIDEADRIVSLVKTRMEELNALGGMWDDLRSLISGPMFQFDLPDHEWKSLLARVKIALPLGSTYLRDNGWTLQGRDWFSHRISKFVHDGLDESYFVRWALILKEAAQLGGDRVVAVFSLLDSYAMGNDDALSRARYLSHHHQALIRALPREIEWTEVKARVATSICQRSCLTFLACWRFGPSDREVNLLRIVNLDVVVKIAKMLWMSRRDDDWTLIYEDAADEWKWLRPAPKPSYSSYSTSYSYRHYDTCDCGRPVGGPSGLCNRCFYG